MSSLEDLRASQDRDLRRVGIPMVVALRDEAEPSGEAGPPSSGAGSAHLADGRRIAAHLDELRADLAADQRDGDMGVVASLLTVAAYIDFGTAHHEDPR